MGILTMLHRSELSKSEIILRKSSINGTLPHGAMNIREEPEKHSYITTDVLRLIKEI